MDEWIHSGVRHAVVAPGSRSTPLAVALAARSEIRVHLFHDERSASFAALGIGLSTKMPAILLCTSGTAATHFLGAVVEAHQSNVPMIVCTADRPPELRDVGAPQTIDQTNLFGSATRWFHDPGVPSFDASLSWRSLASRAYNVALGARPGPVHLNLPFREPLLGNTLELPERKTDGFAGQIRASAVADDDVLTLYRLIAGKRGVILAGRGATSEVLTLAKKLGWPVLADPRSELRLCDENVLVAFDPILRSESFANSHFPDVVLRVGEPAASKVTAQWVTRSKATIVQMQETEMIVDPDHSSSMTLVGGISSVASVLAEMVTTSTQGWLADWSAAETAAQKAIEAWTSDHWSEPTNARTVTSSMTEGCNLLVSSSMPIRDVEWFGSVTPHVQVYSNRGTNGIDGVISTGIGIALGSGVVTTILIGDVACLHDTNGLWALMQRNVDVKIVVTNNDGGSIFSFLPQATQVENSIFELLYGTPHGVSFEHLAMAHGVPFRRATHAASVREALSQQGTTLIEVPFDRSVNVSQHDALNAAVVSAVELATA
ncbi:MAG: 2-succinyl-5-enolpyruvyl-6-hydroxy-3-cyclohexene-carboxylic-acid synthase [Actinomycetota bacterium]